MSVSADYKTIVSHYESIKYVQGDDAAMSLIILSFQCALLMCCKSWLSDEVPADTMAPFRMILNTDVPRLMYHVVPLRIGKKG